MDKIHEHGFVRLDACMADDLSVVNAARVSYGKRSEALSSADKGLINFLLRERHGTPFEHNAFRFHVSCPIFVAREWFRHRIGSFNEISGRYTTLETVGYVPDLRDMRTQTGKSGSYTYEQLPPIESIDGVDLIHDAYNRAFHVYEKLRGMGVANELARIVLPVGIFTEFYWTVNARSLMNFLSLRTHETAQKEIRDYAEQVEKLFSENMPVTFDAWLQNGKVAP